MPHQRLPGSRSGRPERLRSSTRAPPRWPRQARPQQTGRRSSVISWAAPLLPARGTVARRNGFMRCRGGRVFGRPSGPQDRTQQAKLEIPFGHAFDKRGISLPRRGVRVRPVGLRSAIDGRAVLGPGGVARLEGHFAISIIASQASRMLCANRDPYPFLRRGSLSSEHLTETASRYASLGREAHRVTAAALEAHRQHARNA